MPRVLRYSLQELIAQCHRRPGFCAEHQVWLDLIPVGLEVKVLDSAKKGAGLDEVGSEAVGARGTSCSSHADQ